MSRPMSMRRSFNCCSAVGVVAVIFSAGVLGCPAAAEYRLQSGDVVDFAVAGVSDLRQRTPIDIDGYAAFPLAGGVKAAGLTLHELRDVLGSVLSRKEFRQRGFNKVEPDVISSDEITLSISEYRPIYVSGDVDRPGSQTYRPGLTVRQAITLAGGYDLIREKMNNPLLQAFDFQDALQSAWINYAKEKAHIWRLHSELADGGEPPDDGYDGIPLPKGLLADIRTIAAQQRQVDLADFGKQKSFLAALVARLEENGRVLDRAETAETGGLQSGQEDFERIQAAFKQGISPNTRLMDARRAVLLSSTRALQARLASQQARVELEKVRRDLAKVEDQKHADLLKELGDANASLAVLRVRISAARDKLESVAGRTFEFDGVAQTARTLLVRGGQPPTSCDGETPLLPGDVVQVSVPVSIPSPPRTLMTQ